MTHPLLPPSVIGTVIGVNPWSEGSSVALVTDDSSSNEIHSFSPGRVGACVRLRTRTWIHPKHTVITVTTVILRGEFPMTVAMTLSNQESLLSQTRFLQKGGRRHV